MPPTRLRRRKTGCIHAHLSATSWSCCVAATPARRPAAVSSAAFRPNQILPRKLLHRSLTTTPRALHQIRMQAPCASTNTKTAKRGMRGPCSVVMSGVMSPSASPKWDTSRTLACCSPDDQNIVVCHAQKQTWISTAAATEPSAADPECPESPPGMAPRARKTRPHPRRSLRPPARAAAGAMRPSRGPASPRTGPAPPVRVCTAAGG